MQLNEFTHTTGYEILTCIDGVDYERFHELNGSSRRATWKPIRVRRDRFSRRQAFRPSDAPWGASSDILVFRRSAVDALHDILETHGELLPLEDEGVVELYAFNPRARDCFDQVLSKGPRDDDGRLEGATYPIFIPSVVEGVELHSSKFLARLDSFYWRASKRVLNRDRSHFSSLPPAPSPTTRLRRCVERGG
jgi:hypothetical protein